MANISIRYTRLLHTLGISLAITIPFSAVNTAMGSTPIELDPDVNGDVVISAPGHYVDTDGDTFRTITIESDDVILESLLFDGAGTAPAAIRNGLPGLSNVTIKNSIFSGYTGRTITYGFAEGVASGSDRGANWAVLGNLIEQTGSDATAVALFNIDGVTVKDNVITFADDAGSGRRGFNLDGSSAVFVQKNILAMGGDPDDSCLDILGTSPWAIQVSMSDAPVFNVQIIKNEISGTFYAITGLSQDNITGLQVSNNKLSACRGVTLNTGGAAPSADTVFSDVKITANKMKRIGDGSFDGTWVVGLRDLHTTAPQSASCCASGFMVSFEDVKIHGNKAKGADQFLATWPTNLDVYYDVKESGNKLK